MSRRSLRPAATALSGGRLALGLLTVLPVGQVQTERRTVRAALLLAPAVGLGLGALAWVVGLLVLRAGDAALAAAVASVAVLALATRALHLDGLADVADGLASGKAPDAALEVMRRSDVGPFGVATLVLVLLMQVAVVAAAWEQALAGPVLLLGCLTGRLALLWGCRAGVPAARTDGLGALVAGVVSPVAAAAVTASACAGAAVWGASVGDGALAFPAGVLGGVGAALLLLRRARHRLGGVTGDVLGALVETATTATALTLLLLS